MLPGENGSKTCRISRHVRLWQKFTVPLSFVNKPNKLSIFGELQRET